MKVLYLSKPYDLTLKELAVPKPIGEQVLVKLKAAGICGSDVECFTGKSKEGRYDIAPYVPGHEWAGEVVEIGDKVLSLKMEAEGPFKRDIHEVERLIQEKY
jgi:L-iditol 2-dehydrogenase